MPVSVRELERELSLASGLLPNYLDGIPPTPTPPLPNRQDV